MRRFINGKYEGTRLEIMPSNAATTLPDGTPIVERQGEVTLTATQRLAADGELNVHDRQAYIVDMIDDERIFAVGPTIAQQWKAEYKARLTGQGWTARYYREDR